MNSDTQAPDLPFENNQTDISALPRLEDVQFNKLEPVFITVSTIIWALVFSLPVIASLVVWFGGFDLPEELHIVVLVVTAGTALAALLNVLELRVRGYAMRDHDILYQKGLVWRSVTVVPFSRVQHVETHRGPIDRLTGLSELKIYTAGGSSADCTVPGLSIATASALRQAILNHAYEDGAFAAEKTKEDD